MRVTVTGVHLDIEGARILDGVDLDVAPGRWLGLLGPNGCGKSTLLRAVYRVLRPTTGAVFVGGDDVWAELGARTSARRTAVVAQESTSDFPLTVLQVVQTGRLAHRRLFVGDTAEDGDVVRECLQRVGMSAYAERTFATLSGGEKQRVLLARALAQKGSVLVLDEPTNHLDIRARFELLDLVRELRVTTISALHDLDLAAAYCDDACLMQAGRVVAAGPVEDVLTASLIEDVFGVRAAVGHHPLTGRRTLALAPLPSPVVPAEGSMTIDLSVGVS